MITMRCVECQSRFRINNVEPQTTQLIYKFCVNCGSNRISVFQDGDADYWEVLADSYHTTPSNIKMFYNLWIHDKSGKKFGEFVEDTKKLLREMSSG